MSNTGKGRTLPEVRCSLEESEAALNVLPLPIREALNYAVNNFSQTEALELLQEGVSVKDVVELIKRLDALENSKWRIP